MLRPDDQRQLIAAIVATSKGSTKMRSCSRVMALSFGPLQIMRF
jgi:hypothetical protein